MTIYNQKIIAFMSQNPERCLLWMILGRYPFASIQCLRLYRRLQTTPLTPKDVLT